MLHRPKATTVLLLLLAACRSEQPAPQPDKRASTGTPPAVTGTQASLPPPAMASGERTYASAAQWYGRTRGFHFTMKSAEFAIEGDLERSTPGAERVRFRHEGTEWLGATERTGVVWYKRVNGAWTKAAPPPFADMAYQRATLWFDPQKTEGEPQKSGEGAYRFTDANSGDRYDVTVDEKGRIAAVNVAGSRAFAMNISKADEPAKIE